MKSFSRVTILLGCFLNLVCLQSSADAVKIAKRRATSTWTIQEFPNVNTDPAACHTTTSFRLCDPDDVLDDQQKLVVEAALLEPLSIHNPCSDSTSSSSNDLYNVQIAVALVKKMDKSALANIMSDSDESSISTAAAEQFARSIHDDWGVGQVIPQCGGTGVLVFLSQLDRALYISRGPALSSLLTDARLDTVMRHMKPWLRQQDYETALVQAIHEIHTLVKRGKPQFWEKLQTVLWDNAALGCFAGFFLVLWLISKHHQRQRRMYARVKSQLNEIDRLKAEALRGKYHSTSCPICLEDFQEAPENSTGEKHQKGSDGLPLKLLRCGHVFDETCWTEWVEGGSGQVDKCPICNADVGDAPAERERPNSRMMRPGNNVLPQRPDNNNAFPPRPQEFDADNNERRQFRDDHDAADLRQNLLPRDNFRDLNNNNRGCYARQQGLNDPYNMQPAMLLNRYNYERNFRLQRLGARYPTVVQPQQIERWTRLETPLAQDAAFVERDPDTQHHHRSNDFNNNNTGSSFGGSSGFGGGTSGGGRGASW